MLVDVSIFLPAGECCWVVAYYPLDPRLSVTTEFEPGDQGLVLIARTAEEHRAAIGTLQMVLSNIVDTGSLEVPNDPLHGATAAIAIELQQLLRVADDIGIDVDSDLRKEVEAVLTDTYEALSNMREVHTCTSPEAQRTFLPAYFAFIDENPLPNTGGA